MPILGRFPSAGLSLDKRVKRRAPSAADYLGGDLAKRLQTIATPAPAAAISPVQALGGIGGIAASVGASLVDDPLLSQLGNQIASAYRASVRSQVEAAARQAENARQAQLDALRAASLLQGMDINTLQEQRREQKFPFELLGAQLGVEGQQLQNQATQFRLENLLPLEAERAKTAIETSKAQQALAKASTEATRQNIQQSRELFPLQKRAEEFKSRTSELRLKQEELRLDQMANPEKFAEQKARADAAYENLLKDLVEPDLKNQIVQTGSGAYLVRFKPGTQDPAQVEPLVVDENPAQPDRKIVYMSGVPVGWQVGGQFEPFDKETKDAVLGTFTALAGPAGGKSGAGSGAAKIGEDAVDAVNKVLISRMVTLPELKNAMTLFQNMSGEPKLNAALQKLAATNAGMAEYFRNVRDQAAEILASEPDALTPIQAVERALGSTPVPKTTNDSEDDPGILKSMIDTFRSSFSNAEASDSTASLSIPDVPGAQVLKRSETPAKMSNPSEIENALIQMGLTPSEARQAVETGTLIEINGRRGLKIGADKWIPLE